METRGILISVLVALCALPAAAQQTGTRSGAEGPFIDSMSESEVRASSLIGRPVENGSGDAIGEIDDLIIGKDRQVVGVVLSVGGFLGVADKLVAADAEGVAFGGPEQPATVELTAEDLEAAPDFMSREEISAAEDAAKAQRQQQEMMQQQQQQPQQLQEPGAEKPAQ